MYNKLFSKILDSSIWLESMPTRLVWLTLIAAMDENGFCAFASEANLAHRAIVPLPDTVKAIEVLESPDPNSADPEFEGRRVERVPGGWIVLNSSKYRAMTSKLVIQEQTRERVRRFRERNAAPLRNAECNAPSDNANATSLLLTPVSPVGTSVLKKDTSSSRKRSDKPVFDEDSPEMRAARYLFGKIRENDDGAKEPNWQAWAREFDLLFRVDKREDHRLVQSVIDFATSDDFWKPNILSPRALRKQFQRLKLQMETVSQPRQQALPAQARRADSLPKNPEV